jgi:hypothetical protein
MDAVTNEIKIFGVERTCTNFMKEICQRAGAHVSTDWGWKHHHLDDFYPKGNIQTFVCVKDPYHWLVSIRNYCENEPKYADYDPERLLKRFNGLNLHWYDRMIENIHPYFNPANIVKYEDLLKIKEYYNIIKVNCSDAFTDKKRKNYLRKITDRETINLVNRFISDEFFLKFGYEHIG